ELSFNGRMIKNAEDSGKRRDYFSFPEGTDVRVNDIIQLSKSRDMWIVTDTEDHVMSDIFIQMKVFYEKYRQVPIAKTSKVPLEISNLHIEVQNIASHLLSDGHYRQAITDTFIG